MAILTIVKKREDDIARFGTAKEYYTIQAKFTNGDSYYYGTLVLKEKIYQKKQAELLLEKIISQGKSGIIVDFSKERKSENSNHLYRLVSLSQDCANKF